MLFNIVNFLGKLITSVVIAVISSHKESPTLLNLLRSKPPWCCVCCCEGVVCVIMCHACFDTFASFRLITQRVVPLFAAFAALPLHVDFTATLTGNQTGSNIRHPVTYSSVQRAQRVAVAGYRNTHRTESAGRKKTFLVL